MNTPLPAPELVRAAVAASGLSATRFAILIAWRDARTIRRWLAGATMPAVARQRLEHFLALPPASRLALVQAVTEPVGEASRGAP